MQVTITKIFDKQKTSARTGKPFTSRAIKTNEHGERWISGFKGKENENWKEGDTVEIDIEEKGEYLNFTVPKSFSKQGGAGDVTRIEMKVDSLTAQLSTLGGILTDMKGVLGQILQKVDPAVKDDIPDFS